MKENNKWYINWHVPAVENNICSASSLYMIGLYSMAMSDHWLYRVSKHTQSSLAGWLQLKPISARYQHISLALAGRGMCSSVSEAFMLLELHSGVSVIYCHFE